MVFGFEKSVYDAVLFLDDNRVSKEMLLSEFEAVLDGVVGEPEFGGQTCTAVYLKVDKKLQIKGAVFFLIEFDENGNVDPRWNLPLNQLVDTAAFGAEIDGQRVRIASASQCQIPWHQQSLWEPDLSVGSNTLKSLDAAIKANKLGLIVEDEDYTPSPSALAPADSDFPPDELLNSELGADPLHESDALENERHRMAQNIKKQRRFIASLKARHQLEMEEQRIESQKQLDKLANESEQLQKQFDDQLEQLQGVTLALESAKEELLSQQQEFDRKLEEIADQHGVNHRALDEKYRKDFQKRLIEQTGAIREQLEMREVEVYYREEQINRLNKEVEALKAAMQKLQSQDLDSEIEALVDNGVHFVVSEPGLGPISINANELSKFNENPHAYLSDRIGVDIETYTAWREHVSNPVCGANGVSGECCEAPLEVITTPHEFVDGQSNRCASHQLDDRVAANSG